ncbi:MAG: hypothetical protein R3320_11790 [Nitriliruptorales bacterium]|nr:hypothetical protein [Nitriliruptorales bacterium]
MGLFKKKNDEATPLQRAVRELEQIDQRLESDDSMEDDERDELLARRGELEVEIAEMRGEAPPAGREDDTPRPPDIEEEHLTKMR